MVSALAAVLAAVAVGIWRQASASARLRPPGQPGLAQLATRAHARLTRRAGLARRERETVALVRALAAELRAGAPEAAVLAAVTSVAAVTSGAAASAGTASAARASPAAARTAPVVGRVAALSPGSALTPLLLPAAAAVARGASLPDELRRVASAPGAGRLLPVAAAWSVAARHGSSMTGLLDRLADAYDDEDAVRADLAASVAGARASMLLLAGLPLAGLFLGAAVGAHPLRWLLGSPAGWAVCVVAALFDATGLVWTRWLLRGRP